MKHETEQAVVYRIYTEDSNFRPEIVKLISDEFDGFTLLSGVGYWRGRPEQSLVIEIIAEYSDKSKVLRLAADIKLVSKQESVLVFTGTGLVNEIN